MCWIGLPENKHIAQEDIKCKKIMLFDKENRNFRSPYMLTPYELFEEHTQKFITIELEPKPGKDITKAELRINIGIHCFNNEVEFTIPSIGNNRIYFGLSVFEKRGKYVPSIVECTIPKGTLYYENGNKEIVTERLIIDKILKVL